MSPDILAHKKTLRPIYVQFKHPAKDEGDAVKNAVPLFLEHLKGVGFVQLWRITKVSLAKVEFEALMVEVV